jgi:hypothetical protein
MTKDDALNMALEALTVLLDEWTPARQAQLKGMEAVTAIKQALDAPVQEPVWIQPDHLQKAQKAPFLCRVEPHKRDDFVALYTTPPAQPAPLHGEATTYGERLTHAVAVLCGAQPPADMVAEWIANIDVNGEHRLQSWVLCQAATPSWAQGIVVLDAAHVLANDPEEGVGHEDRPPAAQPAPVQDVFWAISYDGKTPYSLWNGGDGALLDLEVARQGGSACKMPLYTAQRTWVGLIQQERKDIWREAIGWGDPSHEDIGLMIAIEAKLKEKNT